MLTGVSLEPGQVLSNKKEEEILKEMAEMGEETLAGYDPPTSRCINPLRSCKVDNVKSTMPLKLTCGALCSQTSCRWTSPRSMDYESQLRILS